MSFSACEQCAAKFHDMEAGSNKEPDLYHALQDFITHLKAAGRSPSTICCYLHDLEMLGKIIGNMKLSHITGTHLEKTVIQLSDSCGAIDETKSQIALYRFSIPNSSSQSALNDWYLNQIKTKVGNGYLVNGYHTASTNEIWKTLPYSQLCTGNVCKFNDDTVPDNSYVAYGAKIIGNNYKNEGGSCSWPNKFLNKDNAGSVTMPSQTA